LWSLGGGEVFTLVTKGEQARQIMRITFKQKMEKGKRGGKLLPAQIIGKNHIEDSGLRGGRGEIWG